MADASPWLFATCLNPACHFRFPVEEASTAKLRCPRCGDTLDFTPASQDHDFSESGWQDSHVAVSALLDNIRSIHNVGSMFRTADGAGLEHLYLCGITATPDHPRLAKAALGAERSVPWSSHANAIDVAKKLHESGNRLWALERAAEAEPLPDNSSRELPGGPIVLIVGNEKVGVDPGLLALCDRVIQLPMMGTKGSLNAAVAFGIASYFLRFGNGAPLDPASDIA